ncbi:MAG TPA: hypothetical protein VGQ37_02410 [Vicinamibacterales bacterium]|nr:hypothetical protein [Vicinamibacterales bacterium]HEV8616211.1 hypothetical protein [Methylomirabilota bacterium]
MTKDGLIRQVLIGGVLLAAMGCATASVQRDTLEQRVNATHVSVMMLPERAAELTQDFIAADPAHAAEITAAAVTSAPQQRDAIMAAGIAAAPGQEVQIRAAVAEATLSVAALPVQVRTYPPVAPAYFEPFPLAWPRTYNWDFSQPLRR